MKWCGDHMSAYVYLQTDGRLGCKTKSLFCLPPRLPPPHPAPDLKLCSPGARQMRTESPHVLLSGIVASVGISPSLFPDTNSLWNKGDRGLDYLHSQHQASCGLFKLFFIRLGNSMATTQAARKPPRLKLPTSNIGHVALRILIP